MMAKSHALSVEHQADLSQLTRWLQKTFSALLFAATVILLESNFLPASGRTRNAELSVNWHHYVKLLLLLICIGYGVLRLPETWRYFKSGPLLLMLGFLIWAAMTVPFAINKQYAALTTGMLACVIPFMVACVADHGPQRFLLLAWGTVMFFLVCCWLVFFLVPSIGQTPYAGAGGDKPRLAGLVHPNTLAAYCGQALILTIALFDSRAISRRLFISCAVFILITVLATDSRTGQVAVCSVLGMYAAFRLPRPFLMGGICFILPLMLWLLLLVNFEDLLALRSRSGDLDELYTVSGRSEVWAYTLDKILAAPLSGFGYGCQRYILPVSGISWAPFDAHNVWLNVGLGGGVTAMLVLTAMILGQGLCGWLQPRMFPDLMLNYVVVFGLAETSIFLARPNLALFLWIAALAWRAIEKPTINLSEIEASQSGDTILYESELMQHG